MDRSLTTRQCSPTPLGCGTQLALAAQRKKIDAATVGVDTIGVDPAVRVDNVGVHPAVRVDNVSVHPSVGVDTVCVHTTLTDQSLLAAIFLLRRRFATGGSLDGLDSTELFAILVIRSAVT